MQPRARPTAPATDSQLLAQGPSFACAYAIDVVAGDQRSSEQWARDAWEGSPAPLRWFMLAGWRLVLRLQLGPRRSASHILCWSIIERRPNETVCSLRSPFLTAYNTFRRENGLFVWSTFVFYDRPLARLIWPPVSLLHRPLVRLALARARRR
jgi:hypothetical protein